MGVVVIPDPCIGTISIPFGIPTVGMLYLAPSHLVSCKDYFVAEERFLRKLVGSPFCRYKVYP